LTINNPKGITASAAKRSDFTRVSTLAHLLIEERKDHKDSHLKDSNLASKEVAVHNPKRSTLTERPRKFITPAESRRRRQRTFRGVALVVFAATFDTLSQYAEFLFSTNRPQAVLIVTALAAAALVAIDTWLLPTITRFQNRRVPTTCESYSRVSSTI
jgi:hypothetical protein